MRKRSGRELSRDSVETPGEVPGEVQVSDQQLETYERIEHIKERYGDDATGRAQIQRRLKDGRLIGLPSIPALTFDTDLVAKRYGGGRYYVRFYQGRQYMGDIEFELDESLQPEPEIAAAASAAPAVARGNDQPPAWLLSVLDKIGDAAKAFAERKQPDPPDPIAMIEKLSVTMRALTPPERPAPPQQSLKDQLDIIKSVVEVGTSIVDARGESGGGESGDVYMSAISKLADPIVELVKTQAQKEQLRLTGPRRVLPAPAQPPATGPVPPQPEPARQETPVNWLMEIQRWLPLIMKRQQKGLSAESTAFFVLDELSDQTLTALAEFLEKPDADAQLQQVLPVELWNNPAWLFDFLTAVRDYLLTEEDDDTDRDAVSPVGPSKVIDLEEEAAKRLGKLRDKPPEAEGQAPEPSPA